MNTKTKTIAVLMAAIMVSAAVVPIVMAQQVPTTGVVSGGTSPPEVLVKWELPDDADAPQHNTPGTQVLPEPDANKPVECYMIARDDNGAFDITNAGFRIEHPAAPDQLPCWMPDPVPEIYAYGDVQNFKVDENTAWEWNWFNANEQLLILDALNRGIAANLLDYEDVYGAFPDDPAALVERLEQFDARFFWTVKDFTCCYAPGDYQVRAWAADTSGAEGTMVNYLSYDGMIGIDLDFDAGIDYGELVPGVPQIAHGDVNMGTPDAPTVHSLVNNPIQIRLRATPMIGVMYGDPINNFDARLDHNGVVIFVAGEDADVPGALIPNWIEKMDFSVYAPGGTPPDTYEGTMTLWIEDYVCPP